METLLTLGLYLPNYSREPGHLEISSQPRYLLKEPVSRETVAYIKSEPVADLWPCSMGSLSTSNLETHHDRGAWVSETPARSMNSSHTTDWLSQTKTLYLEPRVRTSTLYRGARKTK